MRIALVCDWLTDMGGAERVVENLLSMYPEAPLFTSIARLKNLPDFFKKRNIKTSHLQKLPGFMRKSHQRLFPFYPLAFESFDLSGYDAAISSSMCCAKGIITGASTIHICYCHTPMRYIWEQKENYEKGMGLLKKFIFRILVHRMRLWDYASSQRVNYFIANSSTVQKRIKKTYGRESVVIHPPVRCSEFLPGETDGDYYFVLSRLVSYKRFDLAVQACSELGRKLLVVGNGPELKNLKKIANENVKFLGSLPDSEVKKHMSECRALLFPGEEDFGIVPVEAMSCGRPVIAFGRGGALDTVIDGKTGVLFGEQTTESLKEAIAKFEGMEFDKQAIRKHALKFDESVFRERIAEFVKEKVAEDRC
ncbi:MAG: glycosyltransferase [Fibromonadales bacterium]|nr:glycosyltransferase [Fibromonadales bacterium]